MGVVDEFNKILAQADNIDSDDLKVMAEDYLQCFRYFHKEAEVPQIIEFKCHNALWLETNVGEIRFADIPEDEITYGIYRTEIQVLFEELSYTEEEIISFVNNYFNKNWK